MTVSVAPAERRDAKRREARRIFGEADAKQDEFLTKQTRSKTRSKDALRNEADEVQGALRASYAKQDALRATI